MNTAVNQYNYRFKLTDYAMFDRNRQRRVSIYGRVSTEHEAQLSALENQMQWYDDQAKYHPNWTVVEKYIDEGITGTQAKKRPAFLRMLEDARSGKFDLIVTREVCRFARNVVDTLVVTRELKNIGVEVFFIDDNIWTMDGDGELRLSLMATLAQEESRKTSERVKAGQKISRDNGVLYGNGNILGYDRVGDTYVINEEQAETVRMIFDLYLQGYGSMKIANILTERKRKTASGLVKWSISNIMRAIRNATYTGTKCYNKSRSNNFLEQKRINNLDMSTYEYVEGDFPAIVSQEVWDKAQEIRTSRVKPSLVSSTKTTHSKRDSKDIWVNLLRCSCGSSFRKNKWHTKNDGGISYGYQCYNQLNNGNKKKRVELGLDTEGYCDSRMIADWKLDFMAKSLLEHLWTDRKESVLLALDLIKRYYRDERVTSGKGDTAAIQAKLNKATTRLQNLIAMRADGEISKDEYQAMRSPVDAEIRALEKALEDAPQAEEQGTTLNLTEITATLHSLVDFSEATLNHDVIKKFVYMVTPTSDTSFHWYVNLSGNTKARATYTVEGRKKKNVIKLEEIEEISSLHRKENEDATVLIQNPLIFALLHRPQPTMPSWSTSSAKRSTPTMRGCPSC
jgi:site-specific DNA recombinase